MAVSIATAGAATENEDHWILVAKTCSTLARLQGVVEHVAHLIPSKMFYDRLNANKPAKKKRMAQL